MENTTPSQEEFKRRREFTYRAFSPDSEPPSFHDDEEPEHEAENTTDAADTEGLSPSRESGRQTA